MSSTMSSGVSFRRPDADDDDQPPIPKRVRTIGMEAPVRIEVNLKERQHVRFSTASPEVFSGGEEESVDSGIDREELIKAIVKMQASVAPPGGIGIAVAESAALDCAPVDEKTAEEHFDAETYPNETKDEGEDPEAQDKYARLIEKSSHKNKEKVDEAILSTSKLPPQKNDSDVIASIMQQQLFTQNNDHVANIYHDRDLTKVKVGSSLPWWRKKRTHCIALGVFAISVIAIGLGLGVGLSSSKSPSDASSGISPDATDTPAIEPTSAPGTNTPQSEPPGPTVEPGNVEQFRELLYPLSGESLNDRTSPQFQAFSWAVSDTTVRSPEDIEARYLAATVYYSLGGETWPDQYNFLSLDDVCMWNDVDDKGIICTDGEISELNLASNALVGPIPQEIGYLSTLRSVVMWNNAISGALPSTIGDLRKLQYLDLTANNMTGELPDSLFVYNNLRELVLNGNSFSGTINPSVGDMPILELFLLYGSSMSGPLPASVGQSTTLKYIDFTGSSLTGTIPEFSAASTIETLLVPFSDLVGPIPQSLASVPTLVYLDLSGNALDGTLPDFSMNQGSLRGIYLDENQLTGSVENFFTTTPPDSLEGVSLVDNMLNGTLPTSIGQYTELIVLQLDTNMISGKLPTELGVLAKLEVFRLMINSLNGTIPTQLGAMASLDTIRLETNSLTGGIPSELGLLADLTSLRLSQNFLKGEIPTYLGVAKALMDLYLDFNDLEGPIPTEIASLPDLANLYLSNNRLTGEVDAICAVGNSLKQFALNTCAEESIPCQCCNVCCGGPNNNCVDLPPPTSSPTSSPTVSE